MVDLCIINCQVHSINVTRKLWVFIEFCNVIHLVVYANMLILEFQIIMVGQFVGIFVTMFFKMEMKQFVFNICGGL
jgi:hypothetical protein